MEIVFDIKNAEICYNRQKNQINLLAGKIEEVIKGYKKQQKELDFLKSKIEKMESSKNENVFNCNILSKEVKDPWDDDIKNYKPVSLDEIIRTHELPVNKKMLVQKLRDEGVFMKGRNIPTKKYMDNGNFIIKDNYKNTNKRYVLATFEGVSLITNMYPEIYSNTSLPF